MNNPNSNPFSLVGLFNPNLMRSVFHNQPSIDVGPFSLGASTNPTLPVISSPVCNPSKFVGQVVADPWGGQRGECVSLVKTCMNDQRHTSAWEMGPSVRGNTLQPGTPIATFPGGKYSGHAAIYMGQNEHGIQVMDQWKGRPVGERTIRWDGQGLSNNGDSFKVVK